MKIVIILSILLITHTCVCAQDEKRFIFSAEKKLSRFSSDKGMVRFTPSPEEIDSSETALRRVFNGLDKMDKEFVLEDYYRQYMGYYLNGERVIFISASCVRTPFFQSDMVNTIGKNHCFFEASVALPSRQLHSFRFNKSK